MNKKNEEEKCTWTAYSGELDFTWNLTCGGEAIIMDCLPCDMGYNFCLNCGKPIRCEIKAKNVPSNRTDR